MKWTWQAELSCGHVIGGETREGYDKLGIGVAYGCPEHGEVLVTRMKGQGW